MTWQNFGIFQDFEKGFLFFSTKEIFNGSAFERLLACDIGYPIRIDGINQELPRQTPTWHLTTNFPRFFWLFLGRRSKHDKII